MATIANGCNVPLNTKMGTVPDLSGSLKDWFQNISFIVIVKTVKGFEVVETPTLVNFFGVIHPFTPKQLILKPEGQRAWSWFQLFAEPTLTLEVDDVVTYAGVQTRVMAKEDFNLYGYVSYHLVQDWEGSGPE